MVEVEGMTLERRNKAADAWRRAYATAEDPLEGIDIGWQGQERSVDWIVGDILEPVAEAYADSSGDPEDIPGDIAERAAEGLIYTRTAFELALELPTWVLTEEPSVAVGGVRFEEPTPYRVLVAVLYDVAYALAASEVERLREAEGQSLDRAERELAWRARRAERLEADYGGAFDGIGTVYSDADPGL